MITAGKNTTSGPLSKRSQTRPKRGLYTAKDKQARVIGRKLRGQSDRQIAREEGLGRNTVERILSQQEVKIILEMGRSQILELIPGSIQGLAKHVREGNLRAIEDVLYGSKVLVERTEQMLETGKDEFAGRSEYELDYFAKTGRWPEQKNG